MLTLFLPQSRRKSNRLKTPVMPTGWKSSALFSRGIALTKRQSSSSILLDRSITGCIGWPIKALHGLDDIPLPGRPPRLSGEKLDQLRQAIRHSPREPGMIKTSGMAYCCHIAWIRRAPCHWVCVAANCSSSSWILVCKNLVIKPAKLSPPNNRFIE